MNRVVTLAALVLAAIIAVPAAAARKLIAVLPPQVVASQSENGPVLASAMRDRLGRIGFDVIQDSRVQSVLRSRGVDLSRSLSAVDMYDIRVFKNADNFGNRVYLFDVR